MSDLGHKSVKAAPRRHTCECCGKRLRVSEMAARVFQSTGFTLAWCFECWDSKPLALEQYRRAHSA